MGRVSVGIEQTRQLQSNGIFYLFIFELVSSRGRPAEFTFLNMFGLFFYREIGRFPLAFDYTLYSPGGEHLDPSGIHLFPLTPAACHGLSISFHSSFPALLTGSAPPSKRPLRIRLVIQD